MKTYYDVLFSLIFKRPTEDNGSKGNWGPLNIAVYYHYLIFNYIFLRILIALFIFFNNYVHNISGPYVTYEIYNVFLIKLSASYKCCKILH